MTHPPIPIPLTDTPTFASMLNDPQFGELAKQLLDSSSSTTRSSHGDSVHPTHCPSCSTASLAFSMHNPRPALNRGLALLPGSTTDASRLQPARRTSKRQPRTKATS